MAICLIFCNLFRICYWLCCISATSFRPFSFISFFGSLLLNFQAITSMSFSFTCSMCNDCVCVCVFVFCAYQHPSIGHCSQRPRIEIEKYIWHSINKLNSPLFRAREHSGLIVRVCVRACPYTHNTHFFIIRKRKWLLAWQHIFPNKFFHSFKLFYDYSMRSLSHTHIHTHPCSTWILYT